MAKKTAKKTAAKKKVAKTPVEANPRTPEMTQISISLKRSALDKIDRLAAEQNRNRSNFISVFFENYPANDG